jgi:hypothetical protein
MSPKGPGRMRLCKWHICSASWLDLAAFLGGLQYGGCRSAVVWTLMWVAAVVCWRVDFTFWVPCCCRLPREHAFFDGPRPLLLGKMTSQDVAMLTAGRRGRDKQVRQQEKRTGFCTEIH